MADRRMLHRKAAVSSDLAELRQRHGPDAVAFFLQLVPFYDRWGCVPDDPTKLRGMACPLWEDVTAADVRRWITWMVRRNMLARVTGPGGERGLRNPSFLEHQRGTKFDREAPSPYEPKAITERWARSDPAPQEKWSHEQVVSLMHDHPELSNRQVAERSGLGATTIRRLRQGAPHGAPRGAPRVRHGARHDSEDGAGETVGMQAGPDLVRTRSGVVRTRSAQRKGREGSSRPSPSPTPSPKAGESAAAPPEPEPGAQSPPPGVNGHGAERVDLDAIEAAMPASVRGAVKRGRRTARSGGGG